MPKYLLKRNCGFVSNGFSRPKFIISSLGGKIVPVRAFISRCRDIFALDDCRDLVCRGLVFDSRLFMFEPDTRHDACQKFWQTEQSLH